MKIIKTAAGMREWSVGKKIGFVPTMGFLHEGHLSLVRKAKRENDFALVSIFVNPTQFDPKEDFRKYPRNLKKDLALLKKEKVDAVFVPSVKTIYPNGNQTSIKAGPLSKPLCGPFRPGHFDGVCTVVLKLLNIVKPEKTYFGQKDYQQTRVIEQMVNDLNVPEKIVVCPTVRESDGLALSSRNVYLSESERTRAAGLYETLQLAQKDLTAGEAVQKVEATAIGVLTLKGFRVQYFSVCDAETLKSLQLVSKTKKTNFEGRKSKSVVIAVAAYLSKTRLIDNLVFNL